MMRDERGEGEMRRAGGEGTHPIRSNTQAFKCMQFFSNQ